MQSSDGGSREGILGACSLASASAALAALAAQTARQQQQAAARSPGAAPFLPTSSEPVVNNGVPCYTSLPTGFLPHVSHSSSNRFGGGLPQQGARHDKEAPGVAKVAESRVKHLRKAGGEVWSDPTLDEWPDEDFRVFCGDLGNEVTDEVLESAFRKYKSFQRARVIRDKRTGKGKGFGFVSFSDPHDMLRALKEMNRQYIGNRPIRVIRSRWKDREVDAELNAHQKRSFQILPEDSKKMKKFKGLKPVTGGRRSQAIPPALSASGTRSGIVPIRPAV